MHPVPRGGFHKAGEGPAFGDSFPHFSSGRNGAQRSASPLARGATLHQRNGRRTIFSACQRLFQAQIKKGSGAPLPRSKKKEEKGEMK